MEPGWHYGVEIGAGVFSLCCALVMDFWLFATTPLPRRLWFSLAAWLMGAVVGLTPLALFSHNAAWWMVALVLGSTFWGAIRVRHWLWNIRWRAYDEAAAREKLWKLHPKSFDG